MAKNIFKKIASEKAPPKGTKKELMESLGHIEKGKEPSHFYNTKLYGALVNFFKLNRPT